MGAHKATKIWAFQKKEASDVHERLKFKFSKYGHKRLSHIQKNLRRNQASSRLPTSRQVA